MNMNIYEPVSGFAVPPPDLGKVHPDPIFPHQVLP